MFELKVRFNTYPEEMKGIPLSGRIVGFSERSKEVLGLGFFSSSRRELIVSPVIESAFFQCNVTVIQFVRSGDKGDVLSALIDDFKKGEKLYVEGKVSYQLVKPRYMPKKIFRDALLLKDTADWEALGEPEKDQVRQYVLMSWPLEINARIMVQGQSKYAVYLDKKEGRLSGFSWDNPSAQIDLLR